MNVGRVCKLFRAGLPHEHLGFTKDSLAGTLLTFEIANKIIEEENAATNDTKFAKQNVRLAKHKANK